MTRVAPEKRKRLYKPKTKSGCQTCKHVKRDEQRPSCEKCISTGRKCDGYESSNEVDKPKSTKLGADTSIRSLSSEITGNQRERRSFHFFYSMTVPQLSGMYGEVFWNKMVLQATHHEPAIRHAIIALGSLHERFLRYDGLMSRSHPKLYYDDFALQQYNIAIKSLVGPFSQKRLQSVDVCLISCILFSCFETMQGSYGSAIAHLRSGTKILGEISFDEHANQYHHETLNASKMPYVPMDKVEEIFLRLELQVNQMVGGRTWTVYEKCAKHEYNARIPATFTSLSEARNCFIFSWYKCSHSGAAIRKLDAKDSLSVYSLWQQESRLVLEQFSTALSSFVHSRGEDLSEDERKGVDILRIQECAAFLVLHRDPTKREDLTFSDEFTFVFQKIVALATGILSQKEERSEKQPIFSMDLGIVGPLYMVASQCRDPVIRRKAIALLRSVSIQEGVWNSFLTAKVAEKVVEIEEAGSLNISGCGDVPECNRIFDVYPTFDPVHRKGTVRYSRGETSERLSREAIEEVIEW